MTWRISRLPVIQRPVYPFIFSRKTSSVMARFIWLELGDTFCFMLEDDAVEVTGEVGEDEVVGRVDGDGCAFQLFGEGRVTKRAYAP